MSGTTGETVIMPYTMNIFIVIYCLFFFWIDIVIYGLSFGEA